MIFARYIGGGGPGSFIRKKTYVTKQKNGDAVNLNDICLFDEEGKRICFDPDTDHRFKFVENVFGVLIKKFCGLSWNVGKVVIIDDATTNGKDTYYSVLTPPKEVYLDDEYFLLLDHSNIVPGIEVKDAETGLWARVKRVNDAMWVQVEGSDEYRPLTCYELSISDGDIDSIRMVRCINDEGIPVLTNGNQYRVVCEKDDILEIEADDGCIYGYDSERFEFV